MSFRSLLLILPFIGHCLIVTNEANRYCSAIVVVLCVMCLAGLTSERKTNAIFSTKSFASSLIGIAMAAVDRSDGN